MRTVSKFVAGPSSIQMQKNQSLTIYPWKVGTVSAHLVSLMPTMGDERPLDVCILEFFLCEQGPNHLVFKAPDNELVVKTSTTPESTLKKRHNAIAYHQAWDAQAANIICIAWESGDTQIADLLTKLMPGPRLKELVAYVLW
jgi:hypothetical protein